MPNLLTDSAVWLGEQLKDHCGTACSYWHGANLLSVTLVQERSDSLPERKSLLSDPLIAIRTDDFIVAVADLVANDVQFYPEAFDKIVWTDPQGGIRTSVAFPLTGEHCYRFTDPTKTRARIYTVPQEEIGELKVTPSGGAPFTVRAVLSGMRGAELFSDVGQTTKLLTAVAYALRSDFSDQGIHSPPMMAAIVANGEKWAVDMTQTEWGTVLVKIGLQREIKAREYQAQRNAAV